MQSKVPVNFSEMINANYLHIFHHPKDLVFVYLYYGIITKISRISL